METLLLNILFVKRHGFCQMFYTSKVCISFEIATFLAKKNLGWIRAVDTLRRQGEKRRTGAYKAPRRRLFFQACTRPVQGLYEKHFYFKMLIAFEPNVAQRSVATQNDHKSKACLPEASNTVFTMYRRLYEAPF